MSDDGVEMAVDEFAEYCRTQAGLLAGSVERMGEEADDLLDEIDEGAAEVRARLDARTGSGPAETTASPSPSADRDTPDAGADLDSIAELESDLEEKQAIVEAKQARMAAFQDLADGYVELADDLRADVDDGREAMERVVRFEADTDAPAYFEDRLTVCEAASGEYGWGDDESDSTGGADAG